MLGQFSNILEKSTKSPERLVSAVLSAWETQGAAGATARNIASQAKLPVSSIYHHFGDMEHLLQVAQDDAKRAARQWCDQQIDLTRGDAKGPAALGSLLPALIDDWCEAQRTLAFAFRQSQLMALRDVGQSHSRAQWSAIWRSLWERICDRLDLADMALGTAWFFEGAIALHLLRWRRPVDRAALEELCRGWADWLDGRLAGPSPWFELARREAMELAAGQHLAAADTSVTSIAAAAARTIERQGIVGLTHRAVAAEAGVTLGVVSHKYRTSADLLNAAFEAIYRRMIPQGETAEDRPPPSQRDAIEQLEIAHAARENMLGLEELLAAASRDPAFAGFAAQLRYLRGRSSGPYFQAILGPERTIAPIDAAIFSAFLTGRGNACLHEGWTATAADATPLLARLDRRRSAPA